MKKSILAAIFLAVIIMPSQIHAKDNSIKVFIDAGHGGKDNGNFHNTYNEDSINLQIANKVKDILHKDGIKVEMSREKDEYVSLAKRAKMANKSGADLFVSIHQNAHTSETPQGIETFYMGENNKRLASSIQKNLLEYTNAKDRKIKYGNLQVLRDNKIPSVLVECGFTSNKVEGRKLNTRDYQYKIANGIVDGIKDYLNIKDSNTSKSNSKNVSNNVKTVMNNVNVMSDRGAKFNVIGRLNAGVKVNVIDTRFDWHKISYNGKIGYVSGVYVK